MAAQPALHGRGQCLLRASLGGGEGIGAKDSANTREWTDLNLLVMHVDLCTVWCIVSIRIIPFATKRFSAVSLCYS